MIFWIHQVCEEKFRDFFYHHLHTSMVFQLYKTATSVSTKISSSSCEFSLKLSLAYSEMDKSTLLRHVCADFTLSRMTMQSQEEKSYSWSESEMKQIANRFLVSFFCKLLPNLLPSRFFATTASNIWKFFMVSTFSGAKVHQGKLSQFTKNPRKPRKFSHHETFVVYSIF